MLILLLIVNVVTDVNRCNVCICVLMQDSRFIEVHTSVTFLWMCMWAYRRSWRPSQTSCPACLSWCVRIWREPFRCLQDRIKRVRNVLRSVHWLSDAKCTPNRLSEITSFSLISCYFVIPMSQGTGILLISQPVNKIMCLQGAELI